MSVHQKTAQHSQPCRDHQRGSRPRRLSPCSVGLRPPSQGERRRLSHPDCRCALAVERAVVQEADVHIACVVSPTLGHRAEQHRQSQRRACLFQGVGNSPSVSAESMVPEYTALWFSYTRAPERPSKRRSCPGPVSCHPETGDRAACTALGRPGTGAESETRLRAVSGSAAGDQRRRGGVRLFLVLGGGEGDGAQPQSPSPSPPPSLVEVGVGEWQNLAFMRGSGAGRELV